jgi:hypothetical protein
VLPSTTSVAPVLHHGATVAKAVFSIAATAYRKFPLANKQHAPGGSADDGRVSCVEAELSKSAGRRDACSTLNACLPAFIQSLTRTRLTRSPRVFRCTLCLAPFAAFDGDPEAAFGAFEDHVREERPGYTSGQTERQP